MHCCLQKAGRDESLCVLTERELQHEKHVNMHAIPAALCLIGMRLYSCGYGAGIHVYNMDLQHVQHIQAGQMKYVSGVTGLPDGSLVVAATQGLFHLTGTGNSTRFT